MGLISPGGENLLDFLDMQQVLSTYDGDLRDPLWWPHERPVPMRVARGPLGIPLPSMPGQDLVWSQCRNLRIPLQCRHGASGTSGVSPGASDLGSSGGMHVRFPPELCSSVTLPFAWIKGFVVITRGFPTRLSNEAFPQGCPTCHRAVSRSSA